MSSEGDQKAPSLPIWVTLLAVGGVILGGVAGALTGEPYRDDLSGISGRGMAGVMLGFFAGLAVIAFDWFTAGKRSSMRSTPARSLGKRVFAFFFWGVVGVVLIFGCGWVSGAKYWRFWPSSLIPLDWLDPAHELPPVVDAMVGGVVILICYSRLRIRLFVAAREGARHIEAGVSGPLPEALPAPPSVRWNLVAMCTPFIGLACGIAVFAAAPGCRNPDPAIARGILTWCVFLAAGFLSALMANKRGERWWGLTVLGLVLNAALLFPLALWWMSF